MLRGDAVKQKKNLVSFQKEQIQLIKKKLEKCKLDIKETEAAKDKLYEKYAFGGLIREEYQKRSKELSEKNSFLSSEKAEVVLKLEKLESEYRKTEEDMKQIIRYSHIEELTQEIVDIFIKKIYVYKDKRVEIEWNFRMNNV